MGGEVLDDDLAGVVRVAEAHVLKVHLSPHLLRRGTLAALFRQLLGVEEVEDVAAGRSRGLHLGHALGQGAQRGGEEPHVHDEGHDDAKTYLPVHDERRAYYAHGDVA